MTEELLALAEETAAEAGALLASWRAEGRPEVADTKSSPTDVVTKMDRAAETLITERIHAARPGDAVLGEEGGQAAPSQTGVRWVVDPLDGTVNYLYGLPEWGVSIAAEVDGEIVAGVVAAPVLGQTFSARKDGGSWLRRAGAEPVGPGGSGGRLPPVRLRCNDGVELDRALVATGFGYDAGRRKVQGEVVGALLPLVRDIRRAGSAAIDLCMVAAGRVDAFYERGLNYWDYAAGGLVAREAGALVGGLSGRPESTSMTVAAGPALYSRLTGFLAGLDPERDA
ncbi:MAG TPA: inositol monophosphatase family protein [Streptosporangiaceae bacterium]|nr:inositol monophosphatase family protein [Streptosporangiaceae bacterium]